MAVEPVSGRTGSRPQPAPPEGLDRRTFVRGAVSTAAVAAAGAAGMGMVRELAVLPDFIVKDIQYLGIKALPGSPAPRGLPLVPVAVDEEGFVTGLPETEGENHLDWYRHCGHESASGLRPKGASDNRFTFFMNQEKLRGASSDMQRHWWYVHRLGKHMRADDWAQQPYGSGAPVAWRSDGGAAADVVTALVLKLDPATVRGVSRKTLARFMDMDHHLLAVSTFCTHLCCVPGYKEDPTAKRLGYWDMLFCTCHLSRFDPTQLEKYWFTMRAPRNP